MKRILIYPGQIPLETDLLGTNKNTMIALGKLAAAVLGTATWVNGLSVVPTGPASLNVTVNPGEIYALQNIDTVAYSSIPLDTTHQIVKQGISFDAVNLACAAPATAGQSINYLIQAAFVETDSSSIVLPYYNATNPQTAYAGPGNTGVAQNTIRDGTISLVAKAGAAAATGSQVTPAPDAGFVGLFVVTVANGQTTITSASIAAFAGAPIIPSSLLTAIQTGSLGSATAGGTANALTATIATSLGALVNGQPLTLMAAAANTAAVNVVLTLGSTILGSLSLVKGNNQPLVAGDIPSAGYPVELNYSVTYGALVMQNPATGMTAPPAPIQGVFTNLKASAPGTNSTVTFSVDTVVTGDGAGSCQSTLAWADTIVLTTAGAGGLDTGAVAANTFYYGYAITKPDGTKKLIASLSSTGPLLPSGYTKWALLSSFRTDGTANKFLLAFVQRNKKIQYIVAAASNLLQMPLLFSGVRGTYSATAPVYSAVSVSQWAPPIAAEIIVVPSNQYNNSSVGNVIAAPNANYSGVASVNPPPVYADNGLGRSSAVSSLVLESTNIYAAADTAGSALFCLGYVLN